VVAWRDGGRQASAGSSDSIWRHSTDVSHFDGEYERAFETEVAGVRMRAPMMLIHTVAAGGARSCISTAHASGRPDSAAPIRRSVTGAAGRSL